MEETRTGLLRSIIDVIRSLASSDTNADGKVNEEKLSPEEREELRRIRGMDRVETLEGRERLRKKYDAKVNTEIARQAATGVAKKAKGDTEKIK